MYRRQQSCQRKLGELLIVSDDPLHRIVSGVFEVDNLLMKFREVHEASPDRGFIRMKVADFYSRWESKTGRCTWHADDTNGHGYDQFGRTGARFKSGSDYKRPGCDLCPDGHVPVVWCYQGQDSDSMRGSLPGGIVKAALSELEDLCGAKPKQIEVRVQMIWLKPDDWTSKRAFMSWGLA